MVDKITIGNNIKILSKKNNRTLKSIYENVGISKTNFYNILDGSIETKDINDYYKLIAKELNTTVYYLTSSDLSTLESDLSNINYNEFYGTLYLLCLSGVCDEDDFSEELIDKFWADDIEQLFGCKKETLYVNVKILVRDHFAEFDKNKDLKELVKILIIFMFYVMINTSIITISDIENANIENEDDINKLAIDTAINESYKKETQVNLYKKFNEANSNIGTMGITILRELNNMGRYRNFAEFYAWFFSFFDYLTITPLSETGSKEREAIMDERMYVMEIHDSPYFEVLMDGNYFDYKRHNFEFKLK